MDHAVGGLDVGGDDVGVIDHGALVAQRNGQGGALQRHNFLTVDQVGGHQFTRHNVIQQNLREQALGIGQHSVQRLLRERSKGVIRWCEDGEGARAAQCIHQSGLGQRSGERRELPCGDGGVDDVGKLLGGLFGRLGGGSSFGHSFFGRFRGGGGFSDALFGGRQQVGQRRSQRRRQNDAVNCMNHAVGGLNVARNDGGAVDLFDAVGEGELHALSLRRLNLLAIADQRSDQSSRHHMIEQDAAQRLGVFGKGGQNFRRHCGERLIRRSKDGERAFALQDVDQPRRLHKLHQDGEIARSNGGFHNVWLFAETCLSKSLQGNQAQDQRKDHKRLKYGWNALFHRTLLCVLWNPVKILESALSCSKALPGRS